MYNIAALRVKTTFLVIWVFFFFFAESTVNIFTMRNTCAKLILNAEWGFFFTFFVNEWIVGKGRRLCWSLLSPFKTINGTKFTHRKKPEFSIMFKNSPRCPFFFFFFFHLDVMHVKTGGGEWCSIWLWSKLFPLASCFMYTQTHIQIYFLSASQVW